MPFYGQVKVPKTNNGNEPWARNVLPLLFAMSLPWPRNLKIELETINPGSKIVAVIRCIIH